MDKIKLLWLSDSPFTCTGYATISRNILNRLQDMGYDCYYQAHNFFGQDVHNAKFGDGEELKFITLGTGVKPYSEDLLVPRIRDLKPDIFGVLLDTFMLYPWYMNYDYAPAKTLFYFPSDGEGGLPLNCENILRKCNYPVAMSKFAQNQVKTSYNLNTSYIPHAVDTSIFYPLSYKEKERIKESWGLKGKFIVGSVFRNQGRKMADRLLKTFAIFAKKHEDAVLFLHTDLFDNAAVFDLRVLVYRLGIMNRVVFSGMRFFRGFDYKKMNDVYNLMDVFFLSTSGEGFGIPTIEAMSCGIPCVVTDYTTTKELLIDDGKCGEAVPIVSELTGSWTVERGIMDINKGVEALEKLYNDEKLRKEYGLRGREKVLKKYDWNVVIKDWDKLLRRIVNE